MGSVPDLADHGSGGSALIPDLILGLYLHHDLQCSAKLLRTGQACQALEGLRQLLLDPKSRQLLIASARSLWSPR